MTTSCFSNIHNKKGKTITKGNSEIKKIQKPKVLETKMTKIYV